MPGFSALRSDCTHFRSGILSSNDPHASGGIIIFVRQGLSFSELSTSYLSSPDPYSDYVGVNISLNNSSLFSFLNVYILPIHSSSTDSKTDFFSPSLFLLQKYLHSGGLQLPFPLWESKGTSDPCREEVIDWFISSDLLLLNDSGTPTLLNRSSGSRSSPGISFSLSSLVPVRCFRTLIT